MMKYLSYLAVDEERLNFEKPLSSKSKRTCDSVLKEELEVDNTDIYVPKGWQRKLFKFKSGTQKGIHRICYISPNDRKIWCKSDMTKYLIYLERRGIYFSVDVECLNFAQISKSKKAVKVKKR